MSQSKPSVLGRWANVGGTIVTPPSGKQDVGHVTGERPPAQYENWLKNAGYQWNFWNDAYWTNGGNSGGVASGINDHQNTGETQYAPLSLKRDYLGNIRTHTDHNGFRMGQVSEIEEHWDNIGGTVQLPLAAAFPVTGTWAYATTWVCSVAGSLIIPLAGIIPNGAQVTSAIIHYTTGGGTANFQPGILEVTTGTPGTLVAKVISTGTGAQTSDICVSPTTGHSPFQLLSTWDDVYFQVAVTTANLTVYGVTISYTFPANGWTYTNLTGSLTGSATVGDQVSFRVPVAGLNQRGPQLFSTAVGGAAGASVLTGPYETFPDDNLTYIIQFELKTGVITDGSAHRLFGAGVRHNHSGINYIARFYNDNTFANWQLQIADGATTNTDTGIAIAANTVYRMKLELLGGNCSSAGAGHTRVRAYINGALVANVVSNTLFSGADFIQPHFAAATNGTTGGPYDISLGHVRRCWNHLASGDNT